MSAVMTQDCPNWCTDHTGFDDGSDDWHKSADLAVGGYTFYLSTGTVTGEVKVFHPQGPSDDSISLDDAEAFAHALLAAVKAARA